MRAQVMDALTTHCWFDAHYPQFTSEIRASLFDNAVRPLFTLPVDTKHRNYYGPKKPFHSYIDSLSGLDAYKSLSIIDDLKPKNIGAFADLVAGLGFLSRCIFGRCNATSSSTTTSLLDGFLFLR